MHTVMDRGLAQPLAPFDGRNLYIRGLLALRRGDADGAAVMLEAALRRDASNPDIRRNLVRALLVAERFEAVLIHADVALCAAPDDGELHFARGTALNTLGQSSDACAAFSQAIALRPDHAATWLNMGNASADLDDLESAETLYRTALRLEPSLAEAHASLGYVLTRQGRLEEAIRACEAAIALRLDFAQAQWNLSVAVLLTGDLLRGFSKFEWRKRHARYRSDFPDLAGPVWDGTNAVGRTILVRAEQGFGDAIQFARFLPLIRQAGGYPLLVCAPPLVPLMRSMPDVSVVSSTDPLPPYDAWIDQMSLPRGFGTTLETIPSSAGYLCSDPDRVAAWRDRLPAGRKVGIAWAGNPRHSGDRLRSIPAEQVRGLTGVPGVSFVSLQVGEPAAGPDLQDLTRWMTDYAETAALIENLDLVITVDTSVAHLAGALGKRVWIMLPHAPDWRWLLHRTDSPWYDSARLFRQAPAGDWSGVLADVAKTMALPRAG